MNAAVYFYLTQASAPFKRVKMQTTEITCEEAKRFARGTRGTKWGLEHPGLRKMMHIFNFSELNK